jgi:hypothetical protein
MDKLNVKNGTPVGNSHLCKSCNWGQFVLGYRESDLMVICTNTNPNIVVPFTVFDCSEFSDKRKPTFEQMKRLAIHLQPVRISSKTAGFGTGKPIEPFQGDGRSQDEAQDEVTRVR